MIGLYEYNLIFLIRKLYEWFPLGFWRNKWLNKTEKHSNAHSALNGIFLNNITFICMTTTLLFQILLIFFVENSQTNTLFWGSELSSAKESWHSPGYVSTPCSRIMSAPFQKNFIGISQLQNFRWGVWILRGPNFGFLFLPNLASFPFQRHSPNYFFWRNFCLKL